MHYLCGITKQLLIHLSLPSREYIALGLLHNYLLLTKFVTFSLFGCPSSASDHIATAVLEDDQFTKSFIGMNKQRLSQNYELVTEYLRQHDIPYYAGGNAGIFVWADLKKAYRRKSSGDVPNSASSLNARLFSKKVYPAEGELFGGEPGWFRIVFSQPQEYLKGGLRRMSKVLE
jgi:aspartate/methionine/tyrosine aminotransferase